MLKLTAMTARMKLRGLRPVMNPPRLLADALVISHLSTKAIPRTVLRLSPSIAC